MAIQKPELGEIWYFFNGKGDGSGRYAYIVSTDPVKGILMVSKRSLLLPTKRMILMENGGFRYISSNNTLTKEILAFDRSKLAKCFHSIVDKVQL